MYTTINDAKEAIDQKLPDLIIMDIMLPDGNGVDFCRQIKGTVSTSQIPVILMSALEKPTDMTADIFIAKPFSIQTIKSAVERYIGVAVLAFFL